MSHHERALVNDLQSVSKKLSETRSRIGLKSMKINVGSQKNDTEKKRYRQKTLQKRNRYRKNVTHKHSLTIFTNSSPRWRALNKDISNTCFDIKRRDGLRNAYWDPPRRVHAVPAAFETMLPPTLRRRSANVQASLYFPRKRSFLY